MEDVIKIGKKLEKMISGDSMDNETALDLLESLKRTRVTLDVLQKSRIGMTVNSFRKASKDDKVISLSKKLIKDWKKLLPNSSNGSSSSLQRSSSTVSTSSKAEEDSRESMEAQSESANTEETDERTVTSSNDADGGGDADKSAEEANGEEQDKPAPTKRFCAASETSDPIRLKCRKMLTDALKTPPGVEDGHDPELLGAEIEDCIFDEFRNTEIKYKNRVRSRIQNLKDQRNPQLRQNVLVGLIQPEKLASMTSEEMASKEMKDLRARLTKEAIDDHQMSVNSGTVTDMFKCGKCGGKRCTYNQLQTRSADEPMTTFVLCNDCGNRWKFC